MKIFKNASLVILSGVLLFISPFIIASLVSAPIATDRSELINHYKKISKTSNSEIASDMNVSRQLVDSWDGGAFMSPLQEAKLKMLIANIETKKN